MPPARSACAFACGELERATQAAVLQLDPVADREEYAVLDEELGHDEPPSIDALAESEREDARRLAYARATSASTGSASGRGPNPARRWTRPTGSSGRGVVVELGSLATRAEQSLAATAVLDGLWRRRGQREPVLIVIDEAHNVCPAEPEDQLTALATEQTIRIAAEGRKFGLYLLVSTQRPQKVHPNIITQCDNLVLMRLNSAADMAYTETVFSAVPPGLLRRASSFGLGEALVAGKIASHAALLRFGARIAEEGGGDVPSTWARPRS